MARFSCSACGCEGSVDFDPTQHRCPVCGSTTKVGFLVPVEELPVDFLQSLLDAEPLDDDDGD